jgi:hypothetical protein
MTESPHHAHWATLVLTSNMDSRSRLIGAILALRFRNKKTGLICPSVPTLATVAGCSKSTVKRAVKALEAAGWIERTDGRGTGKFTKYRLRWPVNVTSICSGGDHSERVTGEPLDAGSHRGKGSLTSHQRAMDDPFYNNQKSNQKKACENRFGSRSQCPVTSLQLIGKHEAAKVLEWDRQLAAWELPPFRVLAGWGKEKGIEGWRWPLHHVPSDPALLAKCEKYARWLFDARFDETQDSRERRHAS